MRVGELVREKQSKAEGALWGRLYLDRVYEGAASITTTLYPCTPCTPGGGAWWWEGGEMSGDR